MHGHHHLPVALSDRVRRPPHTGCHVPLAEVPRWTTVGPSVSWDGKVFSCRILWWFGCGHLHSGGGAIAQVLKWQVRLAALGQLQAMRGLIALSVGLVCRTAL
jgi:hypothetical protein